MRSVEGDDSKVVEVVHVPSKTASIIEYISVSSDTTIIDEVHMSSNSTNDDMDEIVELIIQCLVSYSSSLVLNMVHDLSYRVIF